MNLEQLTRRLTLAAAPSGPTSPRSRRSLLAATSFGDDGTGILKRIEIKP